MNHEKILVLDFGGQYNQLIARRVRDEGVYAEVYSSDIGIEKIKELKPKGIIFCPSTLCCTSGWNCTA